MRSYLLIFLVFFSAGLFSQVGGLTCQSGKVFDLPKGHVYLGVFGNETDGFVQLSFKSKKEVVIQTLDKQTLLPVSEDVLDISTFGKGVRSEFFIKSKKGYYWYYSIVNKKEHKIELCVIELDLSTKKFSGTGKKIISADDIAERHGISIVSTVYIKHGYERFTYRISSDSSKIAIRYILDPKKYEKPGFYVFDTDMNLLWNKEIELPYTFAELDHLDYTVDLKGNIYFLLRTFDRTIKDYYEMEKVVDYQLCLLKKNDEVPKVFKFQCTGKYCFVFKIKENVNGDILVGSYYTDILDDAGNKKNAAGKVYSHYYNGRIITGLFLMKLQDKSLTKYEYPISADLRFFNLKIMDIMCERDNSFLVTGEEYFKDESTYETNAGKVISYIRENNFALSLMKIDKDMKLQWSNSVNKRSNHFNPEEANTYFMDRFNDNYYIFYLDDSYNKILTVTQPCVSTGSNSKYGLTYVKVTGDGKMYKDTGLFDLNIEPEIFCKISESKILIKNETFPKTSKVVVLKYK